MKNSLNDRGSQAVEAGILMVALLLVFTIGGFWAINSPRQAAANSRMVTAMTINSDFVVVTATDKIGAKNGLEEISATFDIGREKIPPTVWNELHVGESFANPLYTPTYGGN